jgi:murein DD-endopeptidase MepM/ murein hydrolase activator NlpD
MKIRNVIIFTLLIVIVFGGIWFNSTQNKLNKTINTKEDIIIHLLQEKNIHDSLCDNIWKHIPFGSPLKKTEISSGFGVRKDPFTKRWRRHDGLDLKGTYKDTVYSTGGGVIERASYYGGYGRCVVINHGKGYKTMYAHLSRIYVVKGEYVNDHHSIGRVGSTGHSTGAHLHYEVFENEKLIDPERFIWVKL